MNLPTPPLEALLHDLVVEIVERRVASAAALGVGTLDAHGELHLRKASFGANANAWFDLASITKTVTALSASLLADRGTLSLDAPVEHFLPELRGTRGGGSSLRHHLAHRAGLVPHVPLFDESERGVPLCRDVALARAATAARTAELDAAVYSDLGYILVGAALERITGAPLDELGTDILGQTAELGSVREARRNHPSITWVPTEWVAERGGRLEGVVHDDNAWALEGRGLAGHAGLFGTLDGVLRLGGRFLAATRGGEPWTNAVRAMTRRWETGSFRMGFDGVSPRSSAGSLASENTFGHLGFTGTSLWVDPSRSAVVVLLTNRVFFGRDPTRIKATRPRVHDAIWAVLDAERA